MKLSVSAYRAHASAHKKILSSSYQHNYGSTAPAPSSCTLPQFMVDDSNRDAGASGQEMSSLAIRNEGGSSEEVNTGSQGHSLATSRDEDDDDSSNNASSECKSPGQRTKSNQRWMKLRTTVQLSSAMQKKPPLKREDSFLKRFSTRQIPETQETVEDTGSEGGGGGGAGSEGTVKARRRRRTPRPPRTVVNPDENFYFYWLWVLTGCVLYNLWTLIVRQSFPELQHMASNFWFFCDTLTDIVFTADLAVQLRTGYLEQGLMVYDSKKLAGHYLNSRAFLFDLIALTPLDLLQLRFGPNPMLRFPRFLKVYRAVNCYYIVESRTVYPNFWRVINLIHILLILAHWFGCFYFLLSEAEGFQGDWVYPHRPGDYATLTRKYLGSLYWSTLTLTTIGDLPTPETNAEASQSADGPKSLPRRGLKSRLLQFRSNKGYVFTIVSYLIGVFIFATIVGQVGNVITNRNANRLEFERLLDGAKTYMRHHKVPGGMKRRVLRWYDYSWSRGRIQGGGDINTALGLLPDKLKTELALHVNLSVLKKVTIFQECQPEFLHDLVLKMKAYIFTPGDSICRKGEVAREMFIIADGILEVISETGKVLTTMKAGDFFGEIGILNLDGLNKRTADVRSVGYSELFSLSREDVLAAMKDYPEAQEILQTLGRKRLQEARNCSRKAKGEKVDDKTEGEDNSGPRKIVHRLRSDVKGLKNALRSRSRPSRRSGTVGETLELHNLGAGSGNGSGAIPKGVLRRMPRVESDETHHAEDEASASTAHGSKEEKVISPLGAGLPLLARLKLLKERQEKEEKEATMHRGRLSIPQLATPSASASSNEPEVIGAGLPLLQRLLLLKAKEDRERSQAAAALASAQEKTTLTSNPPSSSDTISPSSLKSPLSPTVKTLSPIRKESGATSPGKSLSPTTKPTRKNSSGSSDSSSKPKVSFKDKIMKLQEDGTSISQPLPKDEEETKVKQKPHDKIPPSPSIAEKPTTLDTLKPTISIPASVVSKIKSPAKTVGTTFRDKLKLLQGAPPTSPKELAAPETVPNKIDPSNKLYIDTKIIRSSDSEDKLKDDKQITGAKKPWTKLKKASILSESKDSSSCSRQSSLVMDSPQDTSAAKTDISSAKTTALCKVSLGKVTDPAVASSTPPVPSQTLVPLSENNNIALDDKNVDLQTLKQSDTSSVVSTQGTAQESISNAPSEGVVIQEIVEDPDTKPNTASNTAPRPRQPLTIITRKHKSYVSVEDLSPEYGSLPFVKKLKILNERQKLEELEKEVQKRRSSSLDCPDTGNGSDSELLTRSNSEGSKMHTDRRTVIQLGSQPLLSPESNETLERRNLKSILKKLSEDTQSQDAPIFSPKEFKKLIRAPTIEGYAARHSKFTKSVTFNRDTLTSPPSSGSEQKDLFPLTNPYQRLTNAQSEGSEKLDDVGETWNCDDRHEEVPKLVENVTESRLGDEIITRVPETSTLLEDILAEKQARRELEEISSTLDAKYGIPVLGNLHPEDIRVPRDKPKLSLITSVANQRKLFRGSLEEQEYYSDVLLGIKHVIQGHLHEVQGKFQERFSSLEMEVRKRDEIITQLQSRIQELERIGLTTNGIDILGVDNLGFEPTTPTTPATGEDDRTLDDQSGIQSDFPSSVLNASSGSDDISQDQGFMRGDSLDTVFTTSPPNLAAVEDEENMDNHECNTQPQTSSRTDLNSIDFEQEDEEETLRTLAMELQRLSDSGINAEQLEMLMTGERRASQPTILMSRLDRPEATYSRHRAKKIRERRSWEESCDQETMEMQELPRSLSPLNSDDQHALLSPSALSEKYKSRQRRSVQSHPFHMFGSHLESKSKIKKTSSVDTGIHHTGTKSNGRTEQEHRKFSLGSFFGYHKGIPSKHSTQRDAREDVVLDIGSEVSSDGSSTSSSSESDRLPRTPVFEHFRDSMTGSSSGLLSSRSGGGGGDWEVQMLAEELDRRERDEAKKKRRRQEHTPLRSLEEESDSPTTPHEHSIFSEEDFQRTQDFMSPTYLSPYRLQKTSSFNERTSTPPDWLQRRSRGLILRASSLEHPEPSRSPVSSHLTCKSSSSDGSHKHL